MQSEIKPRTGTSEGAAVVDNERALWKQFAEATTIEAFCQSWLPIQCRMITGVLGALVLLRSETEGVFAPVAVWPDVRRKMDHLGNAAQRALTERKGILATHEATLADGTRQERRHVAFPIEAGGRIHGAVVLEVVPQPNVNLDAMLRQLHWGTGWLADFFDRTETQNSNAVRDRLVNVLELLAVSIEQKGYKAAATTFVTDLATRLQCDRVALGFVEKKQAVVQALSHSANFEKKTKIVRNVAEAMDEALDQHATILFPPTDTRRSVISRVTQTLATEHGSQAVCVVPFSAGGKWIGAISLERAQALPFTRKDIELLEAVVALLGPALDLARREDRNIFKKNLDSLSRFLGRFVGPGHIAWKLTAAALAATTLFLATYKGDYRVTADVTLEGSIQRAVTAPFEGYVLEAKSRAGDIVRHGDLLAKLDDKDLVLERLKWNSEYNQYANQFRQATADHDWAQSRIVGAQMSQAKAKMELLDEQISRTHITAPFDGVLVSGDLSQKLGAPVERGTVMFEIAPLENYRLILKVDDRDIRALREGQRGELSLSSLPNEKLAFTVRKIMPVSVAEEGRNYFRVEADLTQRPDQLRPGMEGVGKVYIEQRNIFWIWTHELVYQIKLWLWAWWR